jgi:hypothetical protein
MAVRIAQLAIVATLLLLGGGQFGVAAESSAPAAPAPVRQKKIFAHYMGCYPVATAATAHHRANDAHTIRHDGKGKFDAIGGEWRNWPLVPEGLALSLEASMDLEIRRALRAGIDGFAIDMWAGNKEHCQRVIAAMFTVAEKKDYPFGITLCLDGGNEADLRWFLETYGASPKLGRIDGKPVIFGYYSVGRPSGYAARALGGSVDSPRVRTTPEGWNQMVQYFRHVEREYLGQPAYWHFCLSGLFLRVAGEGEGSLKAKHLVSACEVLAKGGLGLGSFLGFPEEDAVAKAVRAVGGDWCQPMWFQYDNSRNGFLYGDALRTGSALFRENWRKAREYDSPVMQFVTWNDYTENTNLAPGYQTHYTFLDLNAYFAQWWKTGRQPETDHDRIYVFFKRYNADARTYPFTAWPYARGDGMLEVVTILPRPATVRVPGRDMAYDAPAGVFSRTLPLTPGPVTVEVVRDGQISARLDSPDPVTERPYRHQASLYAFSTEEARHWRADFGDQPLFTASEYGDADGDGLPNWFEMYWFGKFFDWSTAGAADAKGDLDGDGRDHLREYLDQTHPLKPDAPPVRWTGAGAPDRRWSMPANWSVALGNPCEVPVIFGNADTHDTAPKTLDADRTIGGLAAVQNGGTHRLNLDGHALTIAGDLHVRRDLRGAATLIISNGTIGVTGSIRCERGPWDEAAWLRFTDGAVLRGPFKGLYVGTEGDGGNQSYACLDLRGASMADGVLAADLLQIGGSNARGELYLGPGSLKSITVHKLYLSSADTPDMARGGALIGAPVPALGNAWYLPPDVSIHVGSEKARGRLHIHHITSAWGGNRLSRLATQGGGDFEAWLDDLIVSATQGQHEQGSEGWLDLRGMKSFRLDATEARLGTVEGKGTVRSRAYVFFPAGTARVDRLYIGDSINTDSIAQLHLSNTLLKLDELLDMKKSADIRVGVSGRSCGLELADTLRIVRTDTPRITITFQQPPDAGVAPYWGLRQKGDHAQALGDMLRDGTLVLQKGAFPGADAYQTRIYYDPASGFTYAALVRANEAPPRL